MTPAIRRKWAREYALTAVMARRGPGIFASAFLAGEATFSK
jgi:hypothetical protein